MALGRGSAKQTTQRLHQHESKRLRTHLASRLRPCVITHAGASMTDQEKKQRTGIGSEATEGIHSADGDRSPDEGSALEGKDTGRGESDGAGRAGSEPAESH